MLSVLANNKRHETHVSYVVSCRLRLVFLSCDVEWKEEGGPYARPQRAEPYPARPPEISAFMWARSA